jgi:hypothetical protein
MRPVVLAVALAVLVAGAALLVVGRDLPDIELRVAGLRTNVGMTTAETAPGQVFRCARDGLRRIEVSVTPLRDHPLADLELVLRGEGPEGPLLRRARPTARTASPLGDWLELLTFDFEPVQDSGGRVVHLALVPGEWFVSTWVRYRGLPARGGSWGEGTIEGGVHEGELLSEQTDLRGLAFAVEQLAGPATLVLLDAASGEQVRRVEQRFDAPLRSGWAFFSFEPIRPDGQRPQGSRWQSYRFRLEVEPDSVLRATDGVLDPIPFHGSGRVDERLLGMTRGSERFSDRDLVFRAWSSAGPLVTLGLLHERLGWRLPLAFVLFLAACAALALALPRDRRP